VRWGERWSCSELRAGASPEAADHDWRPPSKRSGGELVLVDEPAEEIGAADTVSSARERSSLRRSQVEAAVRSTPVVVLDVLRYDPLEVTLGDHQQVVEVVLSNGAHPALGERVRVGGAHGREVAPAFYILTYVLLSYVCK
jgi:hypothetical protein